MPPKPGRLRGAAELAEFVYCRKAWWLRRGLGLSHGDPARLRAGDGEHRAWGRRLGQSRRDLRWAWLLALLGLLLLFLA